MSKQRRYVNTLARVLRDLNAMQQHLEAALKDCDAEYERASRELERSQFPKGTMAKIKAKRKAIRTAARNHVQAPEKLVIPPGETEWWEIKAPTYRKL